MMMMMMMMEIIAMIMKKKTLFTPSLPLYPTTCFNFGFAGNDDVFAWLMLMMFLMLMLLLAIKTLREVFEIHSKFEFALPLLLFCW